MAALTAILSTLALDYGGLRCSLRHLVFNRSRNLLGAASNLHAVSDALRLQECGKVGPGKVVAPNGRERRVDVGAHDACDQLASPHAIHVSPEGSDATGDGSHRSPFASLEAALAELRRKRAQTMPGQHSLLQADVVLRAGVHRLGAPVNLNWRDSHTKIVACPGEDVQVSGGALLSLTFTREGHLWSAATPSWLRGV